jgi:hypothetical protein
MMPDDTKSKRDNPGGWGIRYYEGVTLLWWKEDGMGYTSDIAEAGLFSEEEALAHNGLRYEGPSAPCDQATPPSEMLTKTQEEMRRLETRLGNLTAFRNRLREAMGS